MKKFLVQIFLLLALIVFAIIFFNPIEPNSNINIPFAPAGPQFKEVQIKDKKLKVEIADSKDKRNKGLGGRSSLPEDQGMLFVYSELGKHAFWMKGLSFPLDFIWIKDDKVVDIFKNAQPPTPDQKDEDLPKILPITEVNKVLEVNAGVVDKLGISVGDTITIADIPK